MSKPAVLLAISSVLLTQPALSDSLGEAIKNGEMHLNFRLRYENVDVDTNAPADKANALTIRTRLNYKTATVKGLTGFVEMDDVTALDDNYNSTTNGKIQKAEIADPESTELNQAWLSYTKNNATAKWGRQRIALDNHRFIGTVGFRQNEQTYDAFSLHSTSLTNTTITTGHIYNVNRIFGEDSTVGDVDHNTNFLNIKYAGIPLGSLSIYGIQLDAKASNSSFDSWDSHTYGLRLVGEKQLETVAIGYTAEWATQIDADENLADYRADYMLLEGSLSLLGINIKLGHEKLGADGDKGYFITPLATLHKFQGWTDQFLNKGKGNIAGGIEDNYFSVDTRVAGVKLMLVYHDFTSEDKSSSGLTLGDDDLGDEWGLLIAKRFNQYGLNLKYARYDAGDRSVMDVDKLWLTATANF